VRLLIGELKVESSRFMLIVLMLTPPWFFRLFFELDYVILRIA
jgi:hypothetical protein